MNKLKNDGFILIENIKYKKQFNNSLNSFYKNKKTDYKKLKSFIDDKYCPVLNKIINNNKIYYGRFRFNDNSLDFTTFQADIYNHTNENIINIYTCIYFFDSVHLEIIPKSHRKDFLIENNNHTSYLKLKKIFIKSGTFGIFHSNIHYRILDFSKSNRLLHIFNTCFTSHEYNKYISKLIIVKRYDSFFVKYINKYTNIFLKNYENKITNYLLYFILYYDIQYKIGGIISTDLSPYQKNNKLISYQNIKSELMNNINTNESNINIICNNNINNCSPGYFYFYLPIIINFILGYIVYYLFLRKK